MKTNKKTKDLIKLIGRNAGDVFVIGARPKMGKTAVLCSMAKRLSEPNKHHS